MPARTIIRLTEDEYVRLNENGGGACLACGTIHEGGVEPDAEGYECEWCGAHRLCGIEQCLILGRLELTDDDE